MAMPMSVTTTSIPPRTRTLLHPSLHILHPGPKTLHNLLQPRHPLPILLQLVDLPHNPIQPLNLRIRNLDRITRPVILLPRHQRALLRQPIQPIANLLHQCVEVPRQALQAARVEQQQALRRGAGRRARRTRARCHVGGFHLRAAQDLDLIGVESEGGVGDGVHG